MFTVHARGRREQSKVKSTSWVSQHEKQVYQLPPEKELTETSTGVFEEKHGSECRAGTTTDPGSVPPCQPRGAWMANLMEEVADASTSKSCF